MCGITPRAMKANEK